MSVRSKAAKNQGGGTTTTKVNNVRDSIWPRISEPVLDLKPVVGTIEARQVRITGFETLQGDSSIYLPFRSIEAGVFGESIITIEETSDWIVDLDETTIDLDTKIGGRVGGSPFIFPSADHFIWAFADVNAAPANQFKGFGVTSRPTIGAVSASATGNFGETVTLAMPAGQSFRFTVGARVIIRAGTALGAAYNQGVIASIPTNATMTVDLDASYAGLSEANADLSSASGLTVLQLDKFQPVVFNPAARELFPGGGIEHNYCYVGHVQTDSSSNLTGPIRRRGDLLTVLTSEYFNQTGIVTSFTPVNISLSRLIGFGVKVMQSRILIRRTAGAATATFLRQAVDSDTNGLMLTDRTTDDFQQTEHNIQAINAIDNSVYVDISNLSTNTVNVICRLHGYFEENF